MARNRDSSPLFDIIRTNEGARRRGFRMPSWISSGREKSAEGQPETDEDVGEALELSLWLTQPVVFRIPRALALLITLMVIGSLVGAYGLGQRTGRTRAVVAEKDYLTQTSAFDEARSLPPRPGLIPSTVEGVDPVPGVLEASRDPRMAGLNYFRLTSLPASSMGEAERSIDFLKDEGLDAALIAVNNGRSLKLVVLQGFERPLSDPKAKQLRERLLMLGRKWKAQHKGSSNWKDMIPEKYKPGFN
jgi:hypothetical protein